MSLRSLFQNIQKLWLALGAAINLVLNTVILALLWVTVFMIYALVLKILQLWKASDPKTTWWIDSDPSRQGTLRQQF